MVISVGHGEGTRVFCGDGVARRSQCPLTQASGLHELLECPLRRACGDGVVGSAQAMRRQSSSTRDRSAATDGRSATRGSAAVVECHSCVGFVVERIQSLTGRRSLCVRLPGGIGYLVRREVESDADFPIALLAGGIEPDSDHVVCLRGNGRAAQNR